MVLCFINKRRDKDVFDRVRYGEVEGGGYRREHLERGGRGREEENKRVRRGQAAPFLVSQAHLVAR